MPRPRKNAVKSSELNDKKFYRLAEAETLYSLGKASMRRIADEAGAVLKVGRVVLIDRSKVDQYLEDTFMI